MRTIIAGSRNAVTLWDVHLAVMLAPWTPTVVLSGTARGADQFGETVARSVGWPVEQFPAFWLRLGPRAGFERNARMAEAADALIAVWDGESRGTKHMIDIATRKGLQVFVHQIPQ